jgi:hypothetical protein
MICGAEPIELTPSNQYNEVRGKRQRGNGAAARKKFRLLSERA